jgi:hypothetical protein
MSRRGTRAHGLPKRESDSRRSPDEATAGLAEAACVPPNGRFA